MAAGIVRGLNMQNATMLTAGMWMDYIIEYDNQMKQTDERRKERSGEKGRTRKATQADFNSF